MKIKIGLQIVFLGVMGFIYSGYAGEVSTFRNSTGDGAWMNAENWDFQTLPSTAHLVRLGSSAIAKVTTPVIVGALQCGANGASEVIVDGGSLTTTGVRDYSAAGVNRHGALTILNKGTVTIANFFFVGQNECAGRVTIHEGTFRVNNAYWHNKDYTGEKVINSRTTIHTGGVLDVGSLLLQSGVMDIAGGTVIIREDCEIQVNEWIEKGRIIAMSGLDGWRIKITVDPETTWTTLTAEEEPIVLGKHPAMPTDVPHRAS